MREVSLCVGESGVPRSLTTRVRETQVPLSPASLNYFGLAPVTNPAGDRLVVTKHDRVARR